MIFDGFVHSLPDVDPQETREWLDSLDAVVDARGKTRARYLLSALLERARELQVGLPASISTPYVNTIPPEEQAWFPGDEHIERRIRAYIRWNAAVMVIRANKHSEGIGGQLSFFFKLLRPDKVVAWTLTFTIIMVLVDVFVFKRAARRIFAWRPEAEL